MNYTSNTTNMNYWTFGELDAISCIGCHISHRHHINYETKTSKLHHLFETHVKSILHIIQKQRYQSMYGLYVQYDA